MVMVICDSEEDDVLVVSFRRRESCNTSQCDQLGHTNATICLLQNNTMTLVL